MNITKSFARNKIFFNRGYGLVGVFGVGYLVASRLQEHFMEWFNFSVPIKVLIPIGIFGVWFIGWLEWKLGFWAEEQRFSWQNNPEWKNREESSEKD